MLCLAFLVFQVKKTNAQCGNTNYTFLLSGSNSYDETYCEIRNAAGNVVHSFGPDVTASAHTLSGISPNNGPFTFWVSTNGIANDNTPSWTILASGGGGTLISGSVGGGTAMSNQGTFCYTQLSSNANLLALTLSSGTLSPNFVRSRLTYTAYVSSSTNSITITPFKQDSNATIQVRVNGGSYATVNSGSASGSLALNYGNNTIDVKVTAQNGTTLKTYSVTAIRLNALDSVGLAETTFPQGSYSLRLLSTNYTGPLVRVNIDGDYYDVYPDNSNKDFSLSSKISAVIGTYNAAIAPATTNNLNSIVDGSTDATVAVWYDQSANSGRNATQATTGNQPSIISLGNIELANSLPTVNFGGNDFLVITSTEFNTNLSGTVVYTSSSSNNSIGASSAWGNMNGILGANQTGNTTDFAYGIYNNKFSAGNGGLSNVLLAGSIDCDIASTKAHSWNRNSASGAISLYAAKNETEGTSTLDTGSRLAVTSIAVGANQTAASGQVFYTGTISELLLFTHIYSNTEIRTIENNQTNYYSLLSANASLTNIAVNKGTLNPAFSSLKTSYIDTVMFSNIVITPTIADTNGNIEISIDGGLNYDPIISGENSDTIALSLGNNEIRVRVNAEDGVTVKNYTIIVTRILSTDANLTNLIPNSLNLSGSFSANTTSYTCSVPNAFKSFKVTPFLSDNRALVQARINGGVYFNVADQTESNAMILNVGTNTVNVKVTAEDGTTVKTYTITVTRNATISNYLTATNSQVSLSSILTVGEAITGFKMVGIPDGLGAFDNNDGTFTLVMNHKLTNLQGITRTHGSAGSFVSKWVLNKFDLTIESAGDLIQNVKLWNKNTQEYDLYNSLNPMPTGFSKFSSADLPLSSSVYIPANRLGTTDKILLNGEENGTEGRAFAHVITGNNADTTIELPSLGKMSWGNIVTCPNRYPKSIVAELDNVNGGQVYFYVGYKLDTGSAVEKLGLSIGKLYGVKVTGLSEEVSGSFPAPNTPFTLVDLGNVKDSSGVALESKSNSLGVTTFLRPEDGAWDPKNPSDFYFVTTNSFNSPSRLWKLKFTNIRNPEIGGTITSVLDGTEGIMMMNNITIDTLGHIVIQEDAGNNAHNGKMWLYNIANDNLFQIAKHDTARFVTGGVNYLTQNEASKGVIDISNILGNGKYLLVNQAHYSTTNELVEGGQLLAMSVSNISVNSLAIIQDSIEIGTVTPTTNLNITCASVTNADYYKWTVPTGVTIVSGQGTTSLTVKFTDPVKFASPINNPKYIYCQASNSLSNDLSVKDSVRISKTIPSFLVSSMISNPNNNLGKSAWTSTTNVGSNGKTVNVASTLGLKVGNLIKLTSGSGNIGTSNTVASITSATQFQLKNNMIVNIGSGAVLKAYFVPQNTFDAYTSASGATNLATLVTVSSTTGLAEGMLLRKISGTGTLKEGTVVSKIIDGQNFTISQTPLVNLSNSAVLGANPVLTNACAIDVSTGITSEIDYSVVATPVRNIGYQYTLPKGARISRIGDSTIIGYDTARTTALKVVSTTATNIGIVFDSSFISGVLLVKPYNNAGLGIAYKLNIKTEKASIFKVTSTAAAIKNTSVRYKASVTNGSEVTSFKWTVSNSNIIPLSGSVLLNDITTNTDTLSFSFTNSFKTGTLKVLALNNCGTGSSKTFVLNGTTTLNKVGQEIELEEEIIENNDFIATQVNVYPNPNNGKFTLSVFSNQNEETAQVSIVNVLGQMVSSYTVPNNNGIINSEINVNLSTGIYFVKVQLGSEVNVTKISVN